MGGLLPTLPGQTPGPGTYADAVIDAWEIAAAIIAEAPIPILDVAMLLYDISIVLVSLFQGKPRAQDTITVATRLMHSKNPAAYLWGTQLLRLLNEQNIVLSSSDADAQHKIGWSRYQFKQNLISQGLSSADATTIADDIENNTTSAAEPLSKKIPAKLPAGFHIYGPQSVLDLYNSTYSQALANGKTSLQATEKAFHDSLEHSSLEDLWYIQTAKNPPTTPLYPAGHGPPPLPVTTPQPPSSPMPPIPPSPPTTPTTPSSRSQPSSPAQPTPPAPPSPPTGPTPPTQPSSPSGPSEPSPPSQPTPPTQPSTPATPSSPSAPPSTGPTNQPGEGDDTTECCAAITAQLQFIGEQLATIGGNQDAQCCVNIVAAINELQTALVNLLATIATPAPAAAPPDFTPIVAAINNLVPAIGAYQPLVRALTLDLTTSIDRIPAAIAAAAKSGPPTDVSGIVAELEKIFKTLDPPIGVYEALAQKGYISSDVLQMVGTGELGSGLIAVFRTAFWEAYTWLTKTVGLTWTGGHPEIKDPFGSIARIFESTVEAGLKAGSVPLYPIIKGIVDGVVAQLVPTAPVATGNIHVDPDLLLAKTLAPALIINAVALVSSYLGWDLSEQFREYVDWASELAGLAEFHELKVGAYMEEGPIKVAHMTARSIYRQNAPAAGAAAELAARKLINSKQMQALMIWDGIPAEYMTPLEESAMSGINARQLIRLFQTGLYTNADIEDELDFAGVRPRSQARLLLAAPYLATTTERNSLRTALETAYTDGMLSDAELTSRVQSIEQNTDRQSLILERAQLMKAIAMTKRLETGYSKMFQAGLIDVAMYTSNLEGIGLQADYAQNLVLEQQLMQNATLHREMLAAEKKLQSQTAAVQRREALQAYKNGNSNAALLEGQLLATGMTVEQALAWVSLAALQAAGAARWVYGLQLQPQQAALLRSQVTALMDQTKKQLLKPEALANQLKQLKIPDLYVNALRATAEAELAKSSVGQLFPVKIS